MSAPAIPQDDFRERVVAAVRDAKQPIAFTGLAKSLKVKKANLEHLRAAVESAVGTGQLHRWPDRGKSQYFWHASPEQMAREEILTAVRDAKEPVTFTKLAKQVGPEAFRTALESAVGTGQVYRWPDRGKSQYFWHASPEQMARGAILTAAATKAVSKADLSRRAIQDKKLPGFSPQRVQALISVLVGEKQLQEVPAFAGASKLLVRTGDSQAYFNTARSFIKDKIRSAGFDPADFFTENSSPRDRLTTTQVDAAALILEAVRSLEPVKGVPVSTLRLRNYVANLSKQEFDTAALELRKKQEVFLSEHVDAYNISQDEKNLLIDGQDGTYYVAIAIR